MTTNFFHKNKEYFISGLSILIIMSILFAIFQIFPFGDNTIAHYDMLSQTIPQSQLIFDFFQGKSPLFYTNAYGLGANTFGYLLYYILSPFNLLTLIGGDGASIYVVNIIYVLKLLTICWVFTWFLKKYFNKLSSLYIYIISLSYCFCGYMFMNYTFFSFLDYLIYAPLLVHCFILLDKKDKILPLGIIIALMILSCFALSCFSLFYLFIIFSFYVFIVCQKENKKTLIIKTLCSALIGVALNLWLLIPCFIQYLSSSRNIGSSLITSQLFYGTPSKIVTLISNIIVFVFSIIFIIKCDKKNKLNKFIILVQILNLTTIFSDEIVACINGGAIFGFYSRYSYILTFTTFICACFYLQNNKSIINENIEIKTYKQFLPYLSKFFLITILILLFCFFMLIFGQTLSMSFSSQYSTFYGFLGYFLTILPILLIILVAYKLNFSHKAFNNIILMLTLITIPTNFIIFSCGGLQKCSLFTDAKYLTQNIDNNERVKIDSYDYFTYSQTLFNVSGVSIFSSMVDTNNIQTLNALGFNTTENTATSNGGTLLSDIIVGNKYLLTNFQSNDWFLKLVEEKNGQYLYENTLVNKSAIAFNSPVLYKNITDKVEFQQKLFEAIGGVGNLLEKVEVDLTYENCYVDENSVIISKSPNNEAIYVNKSLNESEILYVFINSNKKVNLKINSSLTSTNCFHRLYNSQNSKIEYVDGLMLDSLEFYVLNTDKLKNLTTFNNEFTNNYNKITTTINLETSQNILLPYVNLDGYKVYVNGKETNFTNEFLGLMTLNLSAGTNEIVIEFNNPLLKYCVIGLIIGIIFIIISLIIKVIRNRFNYKFVNISFLILFVCILTYFFVYPLFITFYKSLSFLINLVI